MNGSESTPRIRVGAAPDRKGSARPADEEPRTVRLEGAEAPAAPEASAGALESQYKILEKIGDGGMGVVYLAQDRQLSRYVAIKRLNRSALASPSLRQRFFREAKAVAALNHSHIVHVYAMAEDANGPYIVMEYVAGPPECSPNKEPPRPYTLADKIHRDGPLRPADALDLMIKICRAVEHAHQCHVIHRDLKPSNILLDESGEPKIVDFGLARRMAPGDLQLTAPGEKMLSLGYGAPEQETDAGLADERADVYGLGALAYFGVTGQNPRYFREGDLPATLRIPICKALETDPDKRWSSAQELTAALMLVKAPSAIEMPTVRTTWRCKWCDTLNPVLIRYCGKCGWDGGETCAECRAETRSGVQFCGACGADAREYEAAASLLARLARDFGKRNYEAVIEHAGQITAFHPAGPNGRQTVEKSHGLRAQAEAALRRIAELRPTIEKELRDLNCESARRHIEELHGLAADHPFEDELAGLDERTLARDLERVRKAIADGEWDYGLRLCQGILRAATPKHPEARRLLRRIRRHETFRTLDAALTALLVLVAAYVLSAAPVYRFAGRPAGGVYAVLYRSVELLHRHTVLRKPLELYARLWGVEELHAPAARSP